MKLKIFTIFDQKAKAFITPFFLPEEGMAIRTFTDCVNDKEHQFGKHPQDYTLFNVGAWADNTAQIIMNEAPIVLGNGVEFVVDKKDEDQIPLKLEEVN
ncbi:nonstructural protein [Microviridae sp.]|nr:nonstructural protein [Microviridae sp.]